MVANNCVIRAYPDSAQDDDSYHVYLVHFECCCLTCIFNGIWVILSVTYVQELLEVH